MDPTPSRDNAQGSSKAATAAAPEAPPHTPPKSIKTTSPGTVPSLHDTPASARPTTGQEFRTGSLAEKREAIVKDLGHEIPKLPLQYFFDNLLPPIPQGVDLDKVMIALRKNKALVGNRWSQLLTDPKAQKGEDKIFSGLGIVFESIIQAAQAVAAQTQPTTSSPDKAALEQRYVFMLNLHHAPQSERNSGTKPDGFVVDIKKHHQLIKDAKDAQNAKKAKKAKGGGVSWYEFTFPGEWKLDDVDETDRDDNVAKEVTSLQQIMSLDPRRRFAFGMTIENKTTRLWFCSRAVMTVSQSFNFVEDPKKLAHVFISLAFATEVEMGWDPTVVVKETRLNPDGTSTRIYDITVEDRVYTTVRVLSDFAADNILGRATRVFEVTDSEGKLCVLKDAWMDDDRPLEKAIQADIIAAVTAKFGPEEAQFVKKHFMTIRCHGTVDVSPGKRDHTTDIMMNAVPPEVKEYFKLKIKVPVSTMEKQSTGLTVAADKDAHLATRVHEHVRRAITGRIHIRTIYEEVAVTLAKLHQLHDVIIVLRDIVNVLSYIHLSGWVHRDISAGNLYLYVVGLDKGSARGLVGDLEYAKVKGEGATHEVRTGTLDFMAAEVITRGYLYRTRGPGRPIQDIKRRRLMPPAVVESDKRVVPPFHHNMLHDLESIWWIAIWVLFFNNDADDQSSETQLAERNKYLARLFPRTLQCGERMLFFDGQGFFKNSIELLPLTFQMAAEYLEEIAVSLVEAYRASENSLPESLDTPTDIHQRVATYLDAIFPDVKTVKLVQTPKTSDPRKRRIPSHEDDQPEPKKNEDVTASIIPLLGPSLTPNTIYDWNYTTTPIAGYNGRTLPYARDRLLGGSSSVNYMVYSRGLSDDYDRYAAVSGDPGWNWNSISQYFSKHEKFVTLADFHDTTGEYVLSAHGTDGILEVSLPGFSTPLDQRVLDTTTQLPDEFPFNQDYNDGTPLGIAWSQATIGDPAARSSSATSYLGPDFISRPNLDVLIHAQVTKLLQTGVVAGKPSFHALQYAYTSTSSPSGLATAAVNATHEIVLFAGSIGTPQILLLSGIGPEADLTKVGIPTIVNNPSVGQNLSDHPLLVNVYAVNGNDSFDHVFRGDNISVAIGEWFSDKSGPLVDGVCNHLGFLRLPDNSTIFETKQDASAGPGAAHMEMIFSNLWVQPGVGAPATGSFMTVSSTLMSPTFCGYVKLASSNPLAHPIIDPNFLATSWDIGVLRETIKIIQRFVAAPAWDDYIIGPFGDYANVITDDQIDAYARANAATFFHPVATASMSPKGAQWGVVDPDLTVKGVEGLQIADASVIPYLPNGHTQAPVYLFAERGADLIKASNPAFTS